MKSIDIAQLLNDENLVIPINGVPYEVHPISGENGMLLQIIMDSSTGDDVPERHLEVLKDLDGSDVYRFALGDTLDQMQADGLSLGAIRLASAIATRWHLYGSEAAQKMLDELVAQARPAPKDRLPKATPGSKSGRSTASAPRTRTASTRTTGSPKK